MWLVEVDDGEFVVDVDALAAGPFAPERFGGGFCQVFEVDEAGFAAGFVDLHAAVVVDDAVAEDRAGHEPVQGLAHGTTLDLVHECKRVEDLPPTTGSQTKWPHLSPHGHSVANWPRTETNSGARFGCRHCEELVVRR